MSVWLRYYANRMILTQTLGIMELNEEGRWIDRPLDDILAEIRSQDVCHSLELPPAIPHEYWRLTQPGGETLPDTIPESLEPELEPGTPEPLPEPSPDFRTPTEANTFDRPQPDGSSSNSLERLPQIVAPRT